jgi:hypothetical protein
MDPSTAASEEGPFKTSDSAKLKQEAEFKGKCDAGTRNTAIEFIFS